MGNFLHVDLRASHAPAPEGKFDVYADSVYGAALTLRFNRRATLLGGIGEVSRKSWHGESAVSVAWNREHPILSKVYLRKQWRLPVALGDLDALPGISVIIAHRQLRVRPVFALQHTHHSLVGDTSAGAATAAAAAVEGDLFALSQHESSVSAYALFEYGSLSLALHRFGVSSDMPGQEPYVCGDEMEAVVHGALAMSRRDGAPEHALVLGAGVRWDNAALRSARSVARGEEHALPLTLCPFADLGWEMRGQNLRVRLLGRLHLRPGSWPVDIIPGATIEL